MPPITNWEEWNDALDTVELYATAAASRGEFLGQPVLTLVQLVRHLQSNLVAADAAFTSADAAFGVVDAAHDARLTALENP